VTSARSLTPYLLAISAAAALVFARTFEYSWWSNFIDLACSIQDDSFYYFIPAWNGGHGTGFTFGGQKTSGFQPLYEVILTLISPLCRSLESLVRLSINLNGGLFAATGLVIGLATRPLIQSSLPRLGRTAVVLSMSVAAFSFLSLHTVFFSSLTGKENALAAALMATIIWIVLSGRRDAIGSSVLGLLCGLLLLTRIAPASILYAGIAIAFVEGWKGRTTAMVACLIPLIAWALFAHLYFGHTLPMSMLVKVTTPNQLTILQSLKSGLHYGWESGKFALSAGSRFNVPALQARDGVRPIFQIVLMTLALGLSAFALLRSLLTRPISRPLLILLALDVGSIACNVLFGAAQAGRSDDMYYSVWYIYDLPVLVAINCGFALAWLQAQLPIFSASANARASARATAVLAIACAAYFIGDVVWYARLKPYGSADDAKFAVTWQIKKYEVADWFRRNVVPTHEDYKVVAFSAGAVAYYLFDHVVNLDGLANDAAGAAILSTHSAVGYANSIKPDYLIEVCPAEQHFANLERLHFIAFSKQDNYCIDRFIYQPTAPAN
jgi:hypothetical protein